MSKMFVQLISLSFLISNLYNTLNSVSFLSFALLLSAGVLQEASDAVTT